MTEIEVTCEKCHAKATFPNAGAAKDAGWKEASEKWTDDPQPAHEGWIHFPRCPTPQQRD